MKPALHVKSTVLRGARVEFNAPGLPEGAEVDIHVELAVFSPPRRRSVLEVIAERPASQLTEEDWLRKEAELQDDSNSWDR